jgi:hypothetical protein
MGKPDWVAIQQDAISNNSLSRKHALFQAVTELEKALTASGVDCKKERKKRKSLADMFLDLAEREFDNCIWNGPIQKETFGDLLRQGVRARNEGIHSGADIGETECELFVEIIQVAWLLLRNRFVAQPNASAFAKALLGASTYRYWKDPPVRLSIFSEVYLYGSLTRHTEHPKDIDLLLVDAVGDIAPMEVGYSGETGEKEKRILCELDTFDGASKFCTSKNVAAIECGWLNLSVISHLFGSNRSVTLETAGLQKDPFFFLNVACEILRYDSKDQNWTRDFGSMPVFKELSKLRIRLTEIGVVTTPADSRAGRQLERAFAINLNHALLAQVDQVRMNLGKDRYYSRTTVINSAIAEGLRKLRVDCARDRLEAHFGIVPGSR